MLCTHLWQKFALGGHGAAPPMSCTATWVPAHMNPGMWPTGIPAAPSAHHAAVVAPAMRPINNAASIHNSSNDAATTPKAAKTGTTSALAPVKQHSTQTASSRKKSQTAKALLGDTIILKRGCDDDDEMHLYHGREATIISYPEQGNMMTVYVGSKRIKWSKHEYTRPLPEIKDDIWVHIFRFLGSPDDKDCSAKEKELLWVRDAVQVHTQLTSVCQSWRSICHRHLPTILGRLNVNLDAVPTKMIVPMVQWLSKYKLALGVLKFDAQLEDLALLEEMLTRCDTEKLTIVRAYVNKECRRFNYKSSSWIDSAHVARTRTGQNQLIDLTSASIEDTFEKRVQYLGVPVRELTQKQFHDTVAVHCPNLQHLSLSVMLEVGRDERVHPSKYLSSTLFSLQSISKLEVSLGAHLSASRNWPVNGMIFYKMVKNLSNLAELSIKCPHSVLHGKRFLIISPSLKKLDTTGLCKSAWVSCDCPKLELFECNGSPYGNGTRPTDLHGIESFMRDGDLRVNAGQVAFSGLDVPGTCECILHEFFRPPGDDWVLKECRNARFETW